MSTMRVIGVLIGLLVSLPVYLFLFYKILVHIEATELMWFLFYLYMPATILSATVLQLTKDK